MAKAQDIKIGIDGGSLEAAVARAKRYITGYGLGIELASQVKPEQVQRYLDEFATPTKGREASDLRWVEEHRPDWERMVIDGIAWLIAAQEYTAAIEAAQTATED